MIAVVSPYHVTTREPPAMAALLLGERVVTMMPAPLNGSRREQAEAAAGRVPRYLSLLKSWEWTVPLWEAGVLASSCGGRDPVEDVRSACRTIDRDGRFAPLRPLMRPGLFDTDEGYLDAVSRDLLKGGPDPAICVPVSAGMDRFAMAHGLTPMRSEALSLAQQAEARLGARAFALAVPILLRGGAGRLLAARRELDAELRGLRAALRCSADGHAGNGDLAAAARAYTHAFEAHWSAIASAVAGNDDTERPVRATVAIEGLWLPAHAVLESSVNALRSATGHALNGEVQPRDARGAIVERDPLEGRRFVTLVVRVLGGRR